MRLARAFTGRRIRDQLRGHLRTAGRTRSTGATTWTRPRPGRPTDRGRWRSGPGVPPSWRTRWIVLTWNDAESFTPVMDERGDQVAAVITEPAVFNTGCILPEPGYLELLRAKTSASTARCSSSTRSSPASGSAAAAAREYFGVLPDLTTLAKGLGGGFPVAAVGGSPDVMTSSPTAATRTQAPTTRTSSLAPRSARPWTCWRARPVRAAAPLGDRLVAGLRDLAAEAGLPVTWRASAPSSSSGSPTGRSGLARRRPVTPTSRAVRPLVAGDAAARRALSPEPVREPFRVDGAHRPGHRPHARGGRPALPVVAAERRSR